MRLLDLFCGAGGAASGYQPFVRDIVGVDILKQPRYPYEFRQADATTFPLAGFDFVHASPPCQDHSITKYMFNEPDGTAWMLGHTLERLTAWAGPYVVENVEHAHLPGHSVVLCGPALGLFTKDGSKLYMRLHRKFWCNFPVEQPPCRCDYMKSLGYVNGHRHASRNVRRLTVAETRAILGINWMGYRDLRQAIPPNFTRYLMMQYLKNR